LTPSTIAATSRGSGNTEALATPNRTGHLGGTELPCDGDVVRQPIVAPADLKGPQMSGVVRSIAKILMALNVWLYRKSGGRVMGKVGGVPVLLLTVPGRKSGVPRTTPVSYFIKGDDYVVAGTNGGSASEPQWFRNLRSASRADLEIGDRRVAVEVRVAAGEERAALWKERVASAPSFGKYETKTDRQMPMAVLSPTEKGAAV